MQTPLSILSNHKIKTNLLRTHGTHLLNSIQWSQKPKRPQKNSGVRRNIMKSRNNVQNWEMSRTHQQNAWWSTNQPDTMSYLQLPPRKFQEQRRHIVNYKEEEDLSWCNKCGELGHIRAFCTARVYCNFCRMRSHNNKACWNQQRNERVEPFLSSRQTTPIKNAVQQGQIHNYGEQKYKQNTLLTNRAKLSNRPRENNLVHIDNRQAGLQEENAPQDQTHYQKMLYRESQNKEKIIPQQ